MAGALGAQIDLPVGSGMRIIVSAMTSTVSAGESFESSRIHPVQSSAERLG
tara:strand:+ start:14307 stop:14459 length:153 start_codon:yes stop_codon:yes gene_type:complete